MAGGRAISLPPAPERPRGKVSRHNYSFHVSFWKEDLSVILYIFLCTMAVIFSGSTSLGLLSSTPNNENFMEKLSRLRKATFRSSVHYVGCFLPHSCCYQHRDTNARRQKRGIKYGQGKRKRGELEKSKESSLFGVRGDWGR